MNLSFWADVSLIWLSLLCFVGLLVPLVATYFIVRGMQVVLNKTQILLLKTQGYSHQVRDRSFTLGERVREPIVRARTREAKLMRTLRTLWPNNHQTSL